MIINKLIIIRCRKIIDIDVLHQTVGGTIPHCT